MPRFASTPRSDRSIAWVLVVGALDLGLEQFMVIPILPAVQQTYGASLTATTWLLTGFLLAAVTAAPIVGRLGDVYGKRRFLLLSVGAFAIGSLVCALADSIAALIAGRVLQGLGAGLGPLAVGLARDRAPAGRAPVWIGLLVAAGASGAAIGLLLGGVLVENARWPRCSGSCSRSRSRCSRPWQRSCPSRRGALRPDRTGQAACC